MVPGPQAASTLAPAAALVKARLAPGPAQAARKYGKSAGIFSVGGVTDNAPALTKPLQGGYPSTEAWDNIHGGGVGTLEVRGSRPCPSKPSINGAMPCRYCCVLYSPPQTYLSCLFLHVRIYLTW